MKHSPLFRYLGVVLAFFGCVNFLWSGVSIARADVTGYKLSCTKLVIGNGCHGDVYRQGGGMCFYMTSFYTLVSNPAARDSRIPLYIPINTCDSSVQILTPVVDVLTARLASVAAVVGGVALFAYGSIPSCRKELNEQPPDAPHDASSNPTR